MTERTKPGRKVQAEALLGHSEPWIRQKMKDIEKAGVRLTSRITGPSTAAPGPRTARCSTSHVISGAPASTRTSWIDLPGLDAPTACRPSAVP